ncbi:hypothetical protein MYSTI_07629 [Myxococcus stipitatus DSM 14675]|uniref:Lipoprotein n=1 Tax=Myxococcus stipitatus (strain DSM 14675 / JCM 12634 / Mx s8) TaxID=1278073 RepID=L7UIU9_MYXSD|nr:hypothetical protein [Myxococcus stipitatus]AGC48901.1 hypothetical protein MYSTI_07629 [Myxococcus stipitatus DSM 14675]
MEATRRNEAALRHRAWLPWGLLAGACVLGATGAWAGSRSMSALAERRTQLEREAAESEARVAELQALREAMARRLKVLEQQHQAARADATAAAAACAVAPAALPPAPAGPARPEPRRAGKASAKGKKGPRR